MANKSDKKAKESYALELKRRGFCNIKIVKEPSDIVAEKDGEKYYFEIKKTAAKKEYFGAATLTEWVAAYNNQEKYFFVICQEHDDGFHFIEYTPSEFEKFSTIPPFKIFFNVPLDRNKKMKLKRKNKTAVKLNKKRLDELNQLFIKWKNDIKNKLCI